MSSFIRELKLVLKIIFVNTVTAAENGVLLTVANLKQKARIFIIYLGTYFHFPFWILFLNFLLEDPLSRITFALRSNLLHVVLIYLFLTDATIVVLRIKFLCSLDSKISHVLGASVRVLTNRVSFTPIFLKYRSKFQCQWTGKSV